MSLRDQLNSDDDKRKSTRTDPMVDHVVNLSELEKPVGKLSVGSEELKIGGRSLKELTEDMKRVKETPSVFDVGNESFDIHHRRYKNDGKLHPQKAAEDLRLILSAMIQRNPRIAETATSCSGDNHNANLPDHQVFGTMLVGIANIFYRAAGLRMMVTRQTLDPAGLVDINRRIALGELLPESAEHIFEILKGPDELDSTTSLALDVFTGRVFGTVGYNGLVPAQVTLLGEHISHLAANYLEAINTSIIISALRAEASDPKWQGDEVDLCVYLDSINFKENMDKYLKKLEAVAGAKSMKLAATFVAMSLYDVPSDGAPFNGSLGKPFLTSSANMFNEIFSKYIIVYSSAINQNYPLYQSTQVPARSVMLSYIENRSIYDCMIGGHEVTDQYILERLTHRVLHHTLHRYWKDDTVHSRMIRKAAGEHAPRYQGSIEIILSQAESKPRGVKMGSSVDMDDIYGDVAVDNVNIQEEIILEEQEMSKSVKGVLTPYKNAKNLKVLTDGPLVDKYGVQVEVISLGGGKRMALIGMSSFMIGTNDDPKALVESHSETVVGRMTDNGIEFNSTVLGMYYETLCSLKTDSVSDAGNGGALLLSKFTSRTDIITAAASGHAPHELPVAMNYAMQRSINESAPKAYNNIWDTEWDPSNVVSNTLDKSHYIIIDDIEIGIEGLGNVLYPTGYYNGERNALNWISMINTAGSQYAVLDDIDLVPAPIVAMQRMLPNGSYDISSIETIQLGNYDVAVITGEMASHLRSDTRIVCNEGIEPNEKYAVIAYRDEGLEIVYHLSKILKRIEAPLPVDEGDDDLDAFDDIFGNVTNEAEVSVTPDVSRADINTDDDQMSLMDRLNSDVRPSTGIASPRSVRQEPMEVSVNTSKQREQLAEDAHRHSMDMDDILADILDDDGIVKDDVIVDTVPTPSVNTDDDQPKKLPPISVGALTMISYYGVHGDKIKADKQTLKIAQEYYGQENDIKYSKAIALNEENSMNDDRNKDDVIRSIAQDHLKGIEYEEIELEGDLALKIDSMGETANAFMDVVKSNGMILFGGVDTLPAHGHYWILTLRYNEVMQDLVAHVIDVYEKEIPKIEVDDIIKSDDGDMFTLESLMAECDDLEEEDFPVLAEDVRITDGRLHGLTDLQEVILRNVVKKADAAVKGAEKGTKIRPIEILRTLDSVTEFPRRLRRIISLSIVNKVLNITSKHCVMNLTTSTGTGFGQLATFIGKSFEMITQSYGMGAGQAYFDDIENIDILDNPNGSVVVINLTAEDLGMTIDVANVPTDGIGLDLDIDTDGKDLYIQTFDMTLMKYYPATDYSRAMLVRHIV